MDGVPERWQSEEAALHVPTEHRSFARPGDAGGPRVLLLHGGGGSPADFHSMAEDLSSVGVHVLCPLLPAHGRGEEALGELCFADLRARAREAYDVLAAAGEPVTIVAQSMGAALAIDVAVQRDPAGLLALAPALRPFVGRRLLRLVPMLLLHPRAARTLVRWQTEARRGMRAAAGHTGEIACPLLILHSDDDDSVDIRGAWEMLAQASSMEKRLEVLHGQGHVLSMAPDRHRDVFPRVRDFVAAATAGARSPGPRRSPDPRH
ncbi:alpha/beta fold hydrolase [bacterium]|nr:alpha/beta fold hydrolase [bacterium]